MDTYHIDIKSREALDEAQKIHKEVSERELRLNRNNNIFYTIHQRSYLDDIRDKYEIQMIELVKDRRDIYISSAIYYALLAIEQDINKPFGSTSITLSALMLLNISSFVVYQVKSFKMDDTTKSIVTRMLWQIVSKEGYSRVQVELRKILDAATR